MDNYLVSISDQLVQIDPRGLTEMDQLMELISSFGFDNSSNNIPESSRHILDHPYRLGVFQDDSDYYWVADFKKATKLIDLNFIGQLKDLEEASTPIDPQNILESKPYIALQAQMQAHQLDLKHDKQGRYEGIYATAENLMNELKSNDVTDEREFIESLTDCCKDFWQSDLEKGVFDFEAHGDMLPQNHKFVENLDYILIKDKKIAWLAESREVDKYWETSLSYEEFRSSCNAIATWALNAMF